MKITTHLSIMIALFLCSCVYGERIEVIATYKSQRKFEVELDSTVNDAMRDQIIATIKKQSEKEFTLDFNENESEYKEEEKLDDNNVIIGGGMEIVVQGSGGNDVLYRNLKEKRYAHAVEVFGKEFLIKDKLEQEEWKMENETKNIGEYTCFKATYTTTRKIMSAESSSDGDTESGSENVSEEIVHVTAWYTPQIPLQHGPSNYGGLPGLILEVNDGTETILCSKIIMNPEKGINIKEPTKGKVVNQTEYEVILEKKMKEMNEQFQSDGRRNEGGHRMSIKIGG
jgi:GLPGLI family protein